eukprot:205269_1
MVNAELIQNSWKKCGDHTQTVNYIFEHLLDESINPGLKDEFFSESDFPEQNKKMVEFFDLVVANADNLEPVMQVIKDLGAKHNDFNVRGYHYNIVGPSILHGLKRSMGDAWNDEIEKEWVAVYGFLSTTMKDAQAAAIETN